MIDFRTEFTKTHFFIDDVVFEFAHIVLIYVMTEQKHYSYEGHVELKAQSLDNLVDEIEITGYQFLVPCKITMEAKGQEMTQLVNVNLADQKVYDQNGKEWSEGLKDKFFAHMARVNTLPEDFYAADQETVDQADEAKREFDEIRDQQYNEVFNVG